MPCANHPDVGWDLLSCSRCGKDFCGDCIITLQGKAVCAGCKNETIQDVKSGAQTDELMLAGRGARLLAIIIDNLIIGIPMMIILFGLMFALNPNFSSSPDASGSLLQIILQNALPLAIGTIYEGWMLSTFKGQTLGKKALGLRVVRTDGEPISSGQAWGRGLSRTVMGLTQILGIIDALMIFAKNKSTLHDRIAKTCVVKIQG
jgi:uncharacterized RDD family membrane protein YckC